MVSWLGLAIITLILWSLWGFFVKLSLNYLDWKTALMLQWGAAIVPLVFALIFIKPNLTWNIGSIFAIVAGLVGPIGGIIFYQAISKGKASVVIPITALYPVLTTVLIILFLREKITMLQSLGVAMAITSIVLISISVK